MSEARELTVKLSLDSNSFSRGMKMVNAQLKNVDSAFKATTAGTDKYSTRAQKATARVGMLTDKIALQQAAVTLCSRQYGKAQSNLERWRKKQAEAAKAVAKATSEYGENSEQAKATRKEYDKTTTESSLFGIPLLDSDGKPVPLYDEYGNTIYFCDDYGRLEISYEILTLQKYDAGEHQPYEFLFTKDDIDEANTEDWT